jgi:hypothetical protein
MDKYVEMIYLDEIILQCQYALGAVQGMRLNLSIKDTNGYFKDAEDFLHHSSAVSRILWPGIARSNHKTIRARHRGDYLRKVLGVQEDHVLKNRNLRNYFAHFDERLDEWAETSRYKNFVDRNIGPPDAIVIDGLDNEDVMRWYHPDGKEFIISGEKYNVQALIDGIVDIQKKASHRLQEIAPDFLPAQTPPRNSRTPS